ncbi:hypothetical protein Pfo_022364 [Paulownia fortunei]|nr:hypothetical protein Pfo_022364 [Paulownia fortunei]
MSIGANRLNGTLPKSFFSAALWNKDIELLDLSYNFFTGSLAPEFGSMKSMRGLYLSGNQFKGSIPSTVGELQSLGYLTLSSNKFQGPIPESFANILDLQHLGLSYNNLSGIIPKSLEKLTHLKYFNVSFVQLSAKIPDGGTFLNMIKICVGLLDLRNSNSRIPVQPDSPPGLVHRRISYYEIRQATNNFNEVNLIGKGNLGSVYKAIFTSGTVAAVKVLRLDLQGAFRSFDTQCQILCNIHHRNLVKGYSVPIAHCDLKPSNILWDEHMFAHVGDFGIANMFDRRPENVTEKDFG